jgi:hypothetical protein
MCEPVGKTEKAMQNMTTFEERGQRNAAIAAFVYQPDEDRGKMIGSSRGSELIRLVGVDIVLSVLSDLPPPIRESTLVSPQVIENLALACTSFEEKDMLVALVNGQSTQTRDEIKRNPYAAKALTSMGYVFPHFGAPLCGF